MYNIAIRIKVEGKYDDIAFHCTANTVAEALTQASACIGEPASSIQLTAVNAIQQILHA